MHAGRVTAPRRILHQARVTRTEDVLAAVAESDLELARKNDDELPSRRWVPIEEPAHRILAECDLGRREPLRPIGHAREVDRLDVRLSVGTGIQAKRSHQVASSTWLLAGKDSTA